MSHHEIPPRERRAIAFRRLVAGAIFGAIAATSVYVALGTLGRPDRAAFLSDSGASTGLGLLSPDLIGPAAHTSSSPTKLTIPAIGVTTTLEALTLKPDGTLPVPSNNARAGWYAAGVRPGSIGPAIIDGHVDSATAPAVFFRLKDLHVGDEIRVLRQDGTTVRFQVDSMNAYPKAAFPQSAIYGPTTNAVLRLVTCTGQFDQASKNYLDNLVVSSHLLG